ncbi:hypothetical protein LOTGIDRAFT_110936 [Lottia gigantea]|uniref:Sulfotransferase domain-containing protein n=1 Tax=Lottia gigantea TaxID=225164 RepID=V4BAA5_LOTGI|nr:hypothetical protein LOTGIDRAFT_110936 [Lottia gigantea]ESP02862.1 hypothetical protein LOTGIDRAFT_110936 [Lottia gigantea]
MDLKPLVKCEPKEHFENIRDLTIRDDDIVICGYSKAGTHWLWEVLNMLRNKTTEYKKDVKEKQMIEFLQKGDLDKEPSPRVLNTHLYPSLLPKQLLEKKTKLVYLIRNPKDTAVSLYFHFYGLQGLAPYAGDVHDFIDIFLHRELGLGTWFEYVLKWEKFLQTTDNPVYFLPYEDMKENPVHHVKELSKFLEIDVSDKLTEDIVEACSFRNLKKASEEQKHDPLKPLWKEGQSMYRKGQVGDWKNYFTVAENEEFDKVYQEKMKASKLQFRYI